MANEISTVSPLKGEQAYVSDSRAVWERPALRRLVAREAEAGTHHKEDSPFSTKS